MKKRSVTKLLSIVLAASMIATYAAPLNSSAAEISVADETQTVDEATEQDSVETEELLDTKKSEDMEENESQGISVPEVSVKDQKNVGDRQSRELSNGIFDAWTQDPDTVLGNPATNEIYSNAFLHLVSDAANSNSHNDKTGYPAMFVNPTSFDFTKEGYFEFTLWTAQEPSKTRFGVMLGYDGPGTGMFIGYDTSGWFWQKYTGGGGPWYTGERVAAPAASAYTNVRIDWTSDKKATLTVQEATGSNGTPVAGSEPTVVFEKEDFSSLADSLSDKIAIKCGTWSGATTNVYLSKIHYTGQKEIKTFQVQGSVKDTEGNPVESAVVSLAGTSAKTDAEGKVSLTVNNVSGTYQVMVRKVGYETRTEEVIIDEDETKVTTFETMLTKKDPIATKTLSTDEMDVLVGESFPFVVRYEMKGDLAGKIFYGQEDVLDTIKINGSNIKVAKGDVNTTFTGEKAVYEMTLKNLTANIDCVITAELKAEKNTLAFNITEVVNNLTEKDANGYEVYPVQTIEIPEHSLVSVRSGQENANLKGAKVSSNTVISGDKSVDVTDSMTFSSEDFMYGFVSNSELSAGLWSNSEHEGTHVAAYVGSGGASNTRVMATAQDLGGEMAVGLASAMWYYDRKITPTVNGKPRTYVVEHGEMPAAKVAIAGDLNEDKQVDWQDGAIAYREIMNNPYKSEEVPELVNARIAMDFGSQAANPFLTILDGVKRVYLNTDGLGQNVLLKGYGSEGHDSGHPDYGDIGKRIGGAEDMNTLMEEGAEMGAKFGVHINASEMYTEAKAFNDDLSRGNYGWNWLDQGIGINGLYDLGSGARLERLQSLKDQVGDNLDYIYLDVWGNNTSGAEDSWESRNIARQINSMGWRFTTEWGATQEYDSTMQHWAADQHYGGASAKGQNSEVMRFLRNHQKDSWIADYGSYGGAAQAPLLGGLEMTDYEGWSGRTNYDNYITVMYRHNLITKFLQHYKVNKWVDGDAVNVSGRSWIPEMEIILKSDEKNGKANTVKVTRDSNDYTNLDGFRGRTIEYNGTVISKGARTSGDGTEGNPYIGNESYLVPWFWDSTGNELSEADQKLYHWNTSGGTTTWELIDEWKDLGSVVVYELTDEGKKNAKTVQVTDGTVTLEAEAETPYVVYKGEKAQLAVDWQSSRYIYDMGFNDADLTTKRTVAGDAAIVDNVSQNNMLKLEGGASYTTALTNLTPGQKYAVYIGVDSRSDAKAHMTVENGGKVLAANYTERSFINNMVSSDQHHMGSGATVAGNGASYFQNMYVFFTAPEEGETSLTLSREAGEGATYFDDVRVVETKMDAVLETDENGIVTALHNDFENNAQGIWPFVISGPGQGYSGWVTDNRIHLSEAHAPYSNAGYKDKRVDDVLDGNWSVKINGLAQNSSMIYQTIPQNFHFEAGKTYYVSFDYQMGSEGTYEIRVGDGTKTNVKACSMPAAIGETNTYGFSFTASESGQSWIGIYSTGTAADLQDLASAGDGAKNFSGYKDFILDNLTIREGGMSISQTKYETTTAKDKLPLSVEFVDEKDKDTKVTWASSDEKVAYVDQNGTVSFVGFGTAMITATATFNGVEQTLCCTVTLEKDFEQVATFENVWANTQESAGEDGRAVNVTDRNASTIWHSNWSGAGFTVSENNPAIITVQTKEDIADFANLALRQRSGSNGLVQKYELVIGDTFDQSTHTITDGKSTGVIVAENSKSGSVETLTLPDGAGGHYLQIRVLQGSNSFASIADILIDTISSYDTPQERAYLYSNQADAKEDQKKAAEKILNSADATEEEKAAAQNKINQLNDELLDVYAKSAEVHTGLKAEALEKLGAATTEEEKAAAQAELSENNRGLFNAMTGIVKIQTEQKAAAQEKLDAAITEEDRAAAQAELDKITESLKASQDDLREIQVEVSNDAAEAAKAAQAAAEKAQAAAEAAQTTAETAAEEATAAKTAAESAKADAEAAQAKAEAAQTAAETAQKAAEDAKDTAGANAQEAKDAQAKAEAAKTAAETAKDEAAAAQAKAETAATAAKDAQTKAEAAKDAAVTAETNAKAAETAAKAAQKAAETAKDDAVKAATDANKALGEAQKAQKAAETAKGAAETAKSEAVTAKNAAEAAAQAAEAARDSAAAQADVAEKAAEAAKAAQAAAEAAQKKAEEAQKKAEEVLKKAEEILKKAKEEADAKLEEAKKALQRAEELQKQMEELFAKKEFTSSKTAIKSVKSPKKKQAKVSWKKVEGAEGYVIQYAANSKFKKAKTTTVKGGATTQRIIKKLKSKGKYYFRVRAYRTIDGKKIYTSYSSKKPVRVK